MAEPAPTAGRNAWLKDANAFLFSAVCHLFVLILLGLCTVAAGRGWRGLELVAHVSKGEDLPSEADLQTVQLTATPDDSAAAEAEKLFAMAPVPMSGATAIDSLFSVSDPAGGLEGAGVGDMGKGLGGRVGDATEFFGLGGSGNSFVYVVDCSDSMNERHKFDRARYELLQSIEQLGDDQRYFVIFYNDGAYPMNADKPVAATSDEFEQTRRWVGRVVPNGGTNPLPALLYALKLKPDAIYFLSDGKFDPGVLGELRARNRPRAARGDRPRTHEVPIHTIAFVNRETEGLMRMIARQSGGQFRFVP